MAKQDKAGLNRTRHGRAGQGRAEQNKAGQSRTWLGIFDVLLIVKHIIESNLTLLHAALRSNIIIFFFGSAYNIY
jgi:hypothetical protein